MGTPNNPAIDKFGRTHAVPDYSPAGPANEISFITKSVQPPALVYITVDDRIVVAWNIPTFALPVTIRTMMRVLRPDGRVQPEQFDDVISATQGSVFHDVSEGFVLSASAVAITGSVQFPGAAFYRLALVRGKLPTPDVQVPLIEDYVSNTYVPTWPITQPKRPQDGAGRLITATNAAPAAGADFIFVMPASVRRRLMALRATLVTSVAVANRIVRFVVDDGVNILYAAGSSVVQVASQTFAYDFVPGGALTAANGNEALITAPVGLVLGSQWRISSATTGKDAADQWSIQVIGAEELVEA